MTQAVIAYLLVAAFFAIELSIRQSGSARSLETTDSDRGSTLLIGASLGVAVILPPVLDFLGVGQIHLPAISWLGLGIMLLGIGLRAWSMRVLGAFYSRRLRVTDRQVIVTQGPYGVIRHPGYLGSILFWVGFGLALANWIATLVLALPMLGVYIYRIRVEEAMLLTTFGDHYRQYCQHTWKLLPFLY